MFTVANSAECTLRPPSAPADNVFVCEYMEQCNQSTTQLFAPRDDIMNTDTTLLSF